VLAFFVFGQDMYPIPQICKLLYTHLQQKKAPIKEYELIQLLDSHKFFAAAETLPISLQLFHKHFLTMHCLYRLQAQVFPQVLEISPLSILLHSGSEAETGAELAEYSGLLSQFYLDLTQLEQATEDSVNDLLNHFWQRFDAHFQADDAFAVLGLTQTASWNEIKLAYRQRVQVLHPDKGGDKESFTQVLAAYENLKRRFNA
jgi:DNA-J related protein/DnaJ domain